MELKIASPSLLLMISKLSKYFLQSEITGYFLWNKKCLRIYEGMNPTNIYRVIVLSPTQINGNGI